MSWSRDLIGEVMEATWPPLATRDLGPFRLRDGGGGGKRVSAASLRAPARADAGISATEFVTAPAAAPAAAPGAGSGAAAATAPAAAADQPTPDPAIGATWDEAALNAAEAAMAMPLFAIYEGDEALDALLAARGYQMIDPVVIYAAKVADLRRDLAPLAAFPHWPPLETAREIWAEGGIGPDRIRVMERVQGTKTAILARQSDRPAGVVFVGLSGRHAMIHALEVIGRSRRQGAGANLLAAAANWAAAGGGDTISLAVTEQNIAARALYDRVGMAVVGKYHYRVRRA